MAQRRDRGRWGLTAIAEQGRRRRRRMREARHGGLQAAVSVPECRLRLSRKGRLVIQSTGHHHGRRWPRDVRRYGGLVRKDGRARTGALRPEEKGRGLRRRAWRAVKERRRHSVATTAWVHHVASFKGGRTRARAWRSWDWRWGAASLNFFAVNQRGLSNSVYGRHN